MPIRLNLLAEAQAVEELRRRDPVKRAGYVGVCLLALMLAWGLFLYSKQLVSKSVLSGLETELEQSAKGYEDVVAGQKQLAGVKQRLVALQQLTANRYLNGNALQALQRVDVADVRLIRVKTDQAYTYHEPVKGRTNSSGKVSEPGKPAKASERITLTLDAKDSSPTPPDQVNRFKDTLAASPYFTAMTGPGSEPALRNLSPPQMDPETQKPFVLFTIECRYPEKVR